jgi:uncharacterized membrane protein YkgB
MDDVTVMTKINLSRNNWTQKNGIRHSMLSMMMMIIIIIIITITVVVVVVVVVTALQPFVGPWPLFQFLDTIHSR